MEEGIPLLTDRLVKAVRFSDWLMAVAGYTKEQANAKAGREHDFTRFEVESGRLLLLKGHSPVSKKKSRKKGRQGPAKGNPVPRVLRQAIGFADMLVGKKKLSRKTALQRASEKYGFSVEQLEEGREQLAGNVQEMTREQVKDTAASGMVDRYLDLEEFDAIRW